jgi:hypothetical protein
MKKAILILSLFFHLFLMCITSKVYSQEKQFSHGILSTNGVSMLTNSNSNLNYSHIYPFITNQISYILRNEFNNGHHLQFGINFIINRYIYETLNWGRQKCFLSTYWLSLPISYNIKLGANTENFWYISTGVSFDFQFAERYNYFYYKMNAHIVDDYGNIQPYDVELTGKDAKVHNRILKLVDYPSLACQTSFMRHCQLKSGSIEYGVNIQFMEIVIFHSEYVFSKENPRPLNFNIIFAYVF